MENNQKPEIIELHKGKNGDEIIDTIYQQVKSGDIDSYLFTGFTKEGEVVSAKCNVTLLEQQHLASAMQMLTTIDTLKESK